LFLFFDPSSSRGKSEREGNQREREREREKEMESIAVWQGAALCGIVAWIVIASYLNVTRKLRSFLQPWVAHHVITGNPLLLQIQVSVNFCN
jgi:preprotein translocase subunit Sec63